MLHCPLVAAIPTMSPLEELAQARLSFATSGDDTMFAFMRPRQEL